MTMTAPTKEQVRDLTPEQQEAIAATELQRVRCRQQLLERASRGMSAWAGLSTGLVGGIAMFCIAFPRLVPIAIIAVAGLVTFHVARIHKRLDAMMELHDAGIKHATKREPNNDDHAV